MFHQAEVAQLSATLTQRENDLLAAVQAIDPTSQPPPVSNYNYYAVCMYSCMFVCMYVWMYVCMYVEIVTT